MECIVVNFINSALNFNEDIGFVIGVRHCKGRPTLIDMHYPHSSTGL